MEPDEIEDPSFDVVEDETEDPSLASDYKGIDGETEEQRQERHIQQAAQAEDLIVALSNENQWKHLQALRAILDFTMDSMVDGYRNRGCADDYLVSGDELICPPIKGKQII